MCGNEPNRIANFLECHGSINPDREKKDGKNQVSIRLSDFSREQWHFAFATELSAGLKNRAMLRSSFFKRLQQSARFCRSNDKGSWYSIFEKLRWALKVPQWPQNEIGDYVEWHRLRLKQKIREMSEEELAESASWYLSASITDRLEKIKMCFECEADGSAKVAVQCWSNLLNSFYWMLANDIGTNYGPRMCASCKQYFFSDKQNVSYCPDRSDCKERGRRKVDWARNKEKYNRNRRRKRAAKRKRR